MASLNAGKDKQAGDAFFIPALAREQIESLYRGDWLAKKIVDIVPYDCVREWREWQGEAGAVGRARALESRLNLRRAVQRAMVMGRDMIAARQEIDLRPQLERLDRFLFASLGLDPGTLAFTFRPLRQMDAATKAQPPYRRHRQRKFMRGSNSGRRT